MNIKNMRERATFESRQIVIDELGNQSSQWMRAFVRWCEVKPISVTESDGSAWTDVKEKLRLTFRDERLVRELDSRKVRMILRDKVYQVTAVLCHKGFRASVTIDVERSSCLDEN